MFLWKYFVLVVLFALLCVSISGDEQQVDLNEEGASIGTEKEVTYEEALLFESAELGDISGIKKALKRGANISMLLHNSLLSSLTNFAEMHIRCSKSSRLDCADVFIEFWQNQSSKLCNMIFIFTVTIS